MKSFARLIEAGARISGRPYCAAFKPLSLMRAMADYQEGQWLMWTDSSKWNTPSMYAATGLEPPTHPPHNLSCAYNQIQQCLHFVQQVTTSNQGGSRANWHLTQQRNLPALALTSTCVRVPTLTKH